MKGPSRWLAVLMAVAVSACTSPSRAQPLVTKFGLGTLIHPIQEPETSSSPNGHPGQPDDGSKEHVYIFGVNGLNPLCLGNFNGLLGYFRKQGFTNTYFGQLYTSHWFADEIRKIRRKDPQARIVLIGFSLGANYVKAIANDLIKDGVEIDLLIYLVGDLIWDTSASKPSNVRRVVNVRSKGALVFGGDLCNGQDLDGARNYTLKCRHILAPSRRETLTLMKEELLALACAPVEPGAPVPAVPPPATPTVTVPARR